MFRNHFKIAFRQLKKQKFYNVINILGLALSVACCVLITLYIQDEWNHDNFHPNVENIYRVSTDVNIHQWGDPSKNCAGPPILAQTLVEEIPEITKAARLNPHFGNAGSNLVRKAEESANRFEENFVYADHSFFDIFHLPLIYGTKENLLQEPNSLVITERIAIKYYPNKNPIGEVLVLNDDKNQSYTITGVMHNIPAKSNFDFDFFLSMPSLEDSYANPTWIWNNYYTYVTLQPGTDPMSLADKFDAFAKKNYAPQFKEQLQIDFTEMEKTGQYYTVMLQAFSDIYLYSKDMGPPIYEKNGDIRYIQLFALIALFIFLIALVNFINLSTARSANRAKEVGLRKVLGSMRKQLITQFLSESILMSIIAFVLGGFIAAIAIPYFNEIADKRLLMPFKEPSFWGVIALAAIGSGLLAGSYPAIYLSAFEPIKVLKGKLSRGSKNAWLRNGLVSLQFAISIGLIVGTMVVYFQLSYIQNKELGFDKEQILLIQDTYTLGDKIRSFKEQLAQIPEVISSTTSSYLPLAGGNRNSVYFSRTDAATDEGKALMQAWIVDEDYTKTLGMKIIEGRGFNPALSTDSQSVVINQTAIRELGLENPIGQRIAPSDQLNDLYTIIGVVEDFNFESLKGEIGGLGLFLNLSNSVVSIKTNTTNMDGLLAKTEQLWKAFVPNQPFRYAFLNDRFDKMYQTEDRIGKLVSIFALLAIFIACLGLFALATFMTEQRAKEIGIRKVLGASVSSIVFQLSKNFLLPVCIGLLVAVPITWNELNKWLNNFAYHIEIQWWMFLVAGLLAIVIALATVSVQSARAALANPIQSLRDD